MDRPLVTSARGGLRQKLEKLYFSLCLSEVTWLAILNAMAILVSSMLVLITRVLCKKASDAWFCFLNSSIWIDY